MYIFLDIFHLYSVIVRSPSSHGLKHVTKGREKIIQYCNVRLFLIQIFFYWSAVTEVRKLRDKKMATCRIPVGCTHPSSFASGFEVFTLPCLWPRGLPSPACRKWTWPCLLWRRNSLDGSGSGSCLSIMVTPALKHSLLYGLFDSKWTIIYRSEHNVLKKTWN